MPERRLQRDSMIKYSTFRNLPLEFTQVCQREVELHGFNYILPAIKETPPERLYVGSSPRLSKDEVEGDNGCTFGTLGRDPSSHMQH